MRKTIHTAVALALAVGGLSFGCDKNRDDDMADYGGNRDTTGATLSEGSVLT